MNKILNINLATDYIRPEIKESAHKEWVMNGENNKMYKDIITAYYGSPTNSSIIDSYARYVYGLGLNIQQNFISKTDLRKVCFDMVLFGEASFEVTAKGNLYHIEKNKLLPSKAVDGEIKSYWYCFDWSDTRKYEPKKLPTWGYGKKSENQVFVIKAHQVGQFYFANPSYISALPYCEVESELANYYINHIKNGLSFGHVINVNGGKPESEEDLNKFSKQIRNQLTGSSNAGKFLLSFNDNKDSETTITSLQVSDAHKQYDFLTQEAQNKICIAHKVVSGSILGITKSTGFSSNADEIETAFNETYLNVIQPIQEYVIDAIEAVKGLSGLDFVNLRQKTTTQAQLSLAKEEIDLSEFGEEINLEEWELIDASEVDYETEEAYQKKIKELNEVYRLEQVGKVALASTKKPSTGTARPNAKSIQDGELFKSRYRYSGNKNPEREFCKKMMAANKLYRKEDIDKMSKKRVNPGFGMAGTEDEPYDIWLWKGGGLLSKNFPKGTCKHFWTRETYMKKADVNNPLAKQITPSQARKKGEILPTNDKRGYKAPHDMK